MIATFRNKPQIVFHLNIYFKKKHKAQIAISNKNPLGSCYILRII